MKDNLQLAITDTLDFLLRLERESIQPKEAQIRLQSLRKRHPKLTLNLLSEIEAYDQSVHYDALVRSGDEGTVSISYCAERATPWPLLGVHRWSDADLLRVNAYVLKVDEAIAFLDFVWDEASIANQLVNQCVIREELAREPIVLTDTEVQEALDQFRIAKGLFKSEEMHHWLEHNGMTHESLERFVTDNRLIDKVRDRVTSHRADEYFRQHTNDFDTARIARIEVADKDCASSLAEQIKNGTLNFYTAAERYFVEGKKYDDVLPNDLFAVIERRQTRPALGELIFAAVPGELIGPVPSEHGYTLVRVLSITPACLNDSVLSAIKNLLFEDWLAQRRQAAQIQWCWGNASKTG